MRYTLMHKRTPVADVKLDEATGGISTIHNVWNAPHLPLGVTVPGQPLDAKSLNAWWIGRSIPASRAGLREALPLLRVYTTELLLAKCLGLSLSDHYWIRPVNASLEWDDINFFTNGFTDDVGQALFGQIHGDTDLDLMSPDNTSDGWLKKKWIIVDGKRVLVKGGSPPAHQEPHNEILAAAIMQRLGIPHVTYTLHRENDLPYSLCEDFITPRTEFVSGVYVRRTMKRDDETSPYRHYLGCCERLGIADARQGVDQMLTLDFLIVNTDRHYGNFGIVRDAETLQVLSLAPVFDSGTSLWHNQATHLIRADADADSKPFAKRHVEQIQLVSSLDWLDMSALRGVAHEFNESLRQSLFIDEMRRDALSDGLARRVEMLALLQRETRPVQGIGMDMTIQ